MSKALPVGIRIQMLRKERSWSQEELARRIGPLPGSDEPPTKATISKIERSAMKMTTEWLERFAKAFGVSVEEIIGDDHRSDRLRVREIPLVGKITAGNWQEAVLDPVGWVPAVNVGRNAFALTPEGTSMNLVFPDRSHVVIDPDDADLRDGKIYAVMNGDGETTVKMYRADPARLEPRSTDATHRPIMLGREPFTVIGRVSMIMQEV